MNIKYAIDIHISAAELFALTQNYALRSTWDPLTRVALPDANGTHIHYTASNGLSMEVQHISHQPGKVAAFQMIKGPAFFDKFTGSWRYQSLAPNLTRMHSRYHITLKPGWLAYLLTPFVIAEFRRQTHKRMQALKIYAEQHYREPQL